MEGVLFGFNYTLKVVPRDAVENGGMVSGYILNMTAPFNHAGELVMNFSIDHYTYTPTLPMEGTISGVVIYVGGDLDGEVVIGALVSLMDTKSVYLDTTTNETGHYLFEDVAFGNYTLSAVPATDKQGEENVKSGYLGSFERIILDPSGNITRGLELLFYEYVPAEVAHPSVTIIDEDGRAVKSVIVTVAVGDVEYSAVTDENGVAVFMGLTGDTFPVNATFRAEKEGYGTIEWSSGETVPGLKNEKGDDPTRVVILLAVIVIILLVVIVIILLAVISMMFRRKEEEYSFEE
ncbi:MAG: carboxypeptidase-like regulatory domain-containing protein [Candidatus Thermoplasmatota archaeon]|nr:carboxypeptidase-like regulatory domain-containing protein [Candidatus Thermoplasmatota archaeon]